MLGGGSHVVDASLRLFRPAIPIGFAKNPVALMIARL